VRIASSHRLDRANAAFTAFTSNGYGVVLGE
jgi:hypothetical protein